MSKPPDSALVVASSAGLASEICERLERAGWAGVPVVGMPAALRAQRAQHPWLLVIDAAIAAHEVSTVCAEAQSTARDSSALTVLLLGPEPTQEDYALGQRLGITDYLSFDLEGPALKARMVALRRLHDAERSQPSEAPKPYDPTSEGSSWHKDLAAAEAARRESDDRFQSLVRASPSGIYLTDIEGRCVYANDSWCAMAGLSPSEALGDGWQTGLHPDDRERVLAAWKEMVAWGSDWAQDYRFVSREGGTTWVSGTIASIRDSAGQVTGYVGINIDITKRKEIEEALKASDERFALAMEAAQDGLFDWDLRTNSIFYSPGWKRILGYDDDELKNEFDTWSTLTHPEDVETSWAMLNEVIERRRPRFELEFRMRHKDGSWVDILSRANALFDEHNEPTRVVGTHVDITERKKSRARVEELVTKLEQAQDVARLGSWEYELATEQSTWSKQMFRIAGIDPSQGEPSWQEHQSRVHPDDWPKVMNAFSEGLQLGRAHFFEYRVAWSEGQYRWVSSQTRAVRNSDGEIIRLQGTTQDIHERKCIEEELRESENKYRTLAENIGIGVAMVSPQMKVLTVNRQMREWFPSIAQRNLCHEAFNCSVVDTSCSACPTVKTMVDGQTHERSVQMQTADGVQLFRVVSTPVIGAGGQVEAAIEMIENVTSRRRAESALEDSEKRFRSLFEGVPISLWEEDYSQVLAYLDTLGFRELTDFVQYLDAHPEVVKECASRVSITTVNQATLALHGASSSEDLIAGLPGTFTPRSYEAFKSQLVAIWRGQDSWRSHTELKTLDGAPLQVVVQWHVPAEHLATMSRVFVSITDLSEKSSLERQLLQAQKMESVGRLAGGVAHDFNNLLTVILNYSSLIREALDPNDPLYEDIEEVRMAGERAADLTRQLLAFSRKQIVEPQVVSLNTILTSSQKMLQRVIGEDINLIFNLADDLEDVDIDPGQVSQILMNLAVNARDAMADGGRLSVQTSNVMVDHTFLEQRPYATYGRHVVMTVADSGHGMDSETQNKVFEPFFTTKDVDRGTGLGLSTVYGIVKQAGGIIEVESEIEVGTRFQIYLPVAVREAGSPVLSVGGTTSQSHSATVLLIEDEAAVRAVTTRILKAGGHTVLEAGHPFEALGLAKLHGSAIDLVLTDVIMPAMSGMECYQELSGIVPDLKVLYMSGYTPDAIAQRGVLTEGTHFIRKPFTVRALQDKVRAVLEGRDQGSSDVTVDD